MKLKRRNTPNDVVVDGDVAKLMVQSRAGETFWITVDIGDLDRVKPFIWSVRKWVMRRTGVIVMYAFTNMNKDGYRRPVEMHRFLLDPPDHLEVDHVDGDGLNNRRTNIRLVSHQGNSFNQTRAAGCSPMSNGKWRSYINVNGKQIHLGCFATEQQAHNEYLEAKKLHHKVET